MKKIVLLLVSLLSIGVVWFFLQHSKQQEPVSKKLTLSIPKNDTVANPAIVPVNQFVKTQEPVKTEVPVKVQMPVTTQVQAKQPIQPIQPIIKKPSENFHKLNQVVRLAKKDQIKKIARVPEAKKSPQAKGLRLEALNKKLNQIPSALNSKYSDSLRYPRKSHLFARTKRKNEQNLQMNQEMLQLGRSIQIGGEYSSQFGSVLNTKWGYQFNKRFAAMVEGDIGAKERRLAMTLAFMPTAHQRVKLTAEDLTQDLNFNFVTGSKRYWINQGAIGGEYDYLFSHSNTSSYWPVLDSLGVSGYYSKAQSKNLGSRDLIYQDDQGYREHLTALRIAGGTSKDIQGHVELSPWARSLLNLGVGYNSVNYDRHYQSNVHDSGIGGSVSFDQYLGQQLKFNLAGNFQSAYDDYHAGLSYLAPVSSHSLLELGLSAEHVKGLLGLKNDNRVGVNVNYNWNQIHQSSKDQVPSDAKNHAQDFLDWAMVPAVHMEKVLAITDQKITWVPKSPTSSSIDDMWVDVGTVYDHDFSDNFDLNGEEGIFDYDLSTISLSTPFSLKGSPINLKIKDPSSHKAQVVSTDSGISNNSVDSRVTLAGAKWSRGKKIGTTKDSFNIYVTPTSLQGPTVIRYDYNPGNPQPCSVDNNAAQEGEFNAHGGALYYGMSGDTTGLSIDHSTGRIMGQLPIDADQPVEISAYKAGVPNGQAHPTSWRVNFQCSVNPD